MSEEFKTKSIMACEQCGANLIVDPNQETVVCEYCGTSYSVSSLLGDSEEVRLNKLKFKQEQERKAQREADFAKRAQIRAEEDERKRQEKFDKGIFSKSLIIGFVFVLFMLVGAIEEQWYITSALLIGQAIFIALAWLTGRQVIHTKNKLAYRVFTILVVAMIVPVIICLAEEDSYSYTYEDHSVTYEWPETELTTLIPKPETEYGDINVNNTTLFDIDTYNVDANQWNKYVSDCKTRGFTLEQESSSTRYSAFNAEGYKLEIYYFNDEEMDISLLSPRGNGTLSWPTTGPATMLPKPSSAQGRILYESTDNLEVEVGSTNKEAYSSYVEACINAGFNVDYTREKEYFRGNNKDGWRLNVDDYGHDVMIIKLWKRSF